MIAIARDNQSAAGAFDRERNVIGFERPAIRCPLWQPRRARAVSTQSVWVMVRAVVLLMWRSNSTDGHTLRT